MVLTLEEVARILQVKPRTVRRYKFACTEPIMGSPRIGLQFRAPDLAQELRGRGFPMLADRIDQYVERASRATVQEIHSYAH